MGTRQALIFLGPSLSHEKARKVFPEAQYLPPAKKGDLVALATKARDDDQHLFVGLIDGVFLQDYPPTPIEVFQLIRQPNVHVAGASSLGALRAVELEKFGMVGVGKIFNLFMMGKLDADDEVAVTFSQDNYQLLSEAMVDIRYNLFLAQKRGIISRPAKVALSKVAKRIYFPNRNYLHIINETRQQYPSLSSEFEGFAKYINSNRTSLKEIDAIKLLQYAKSIMSGSQSNLRST